MFKLGIAVYPEHDSVEKVINYITLANKYKFSRLFLNLIELGTRKDEIIKKFTTVCQHAKKLGWQVILDVNPRVFKELNFEFDSDQAINFFNSLGATGMRLDEDFGGQREAKLLNNKKMNLSLEINASAFTKIEDRIIKNGGDPKKISACHNFYPQSYTGLSLKLFTESSMKLKNLGVEVFAFITLDKNKKTIGPWTTNEGMPTLEFCRDKSISYQTRYLQSSGCVDGILISAMYANEQELATISKYSEQKIIFDIEVDKATTKEEHEIAFNYNEHLVRGDYSDYMLRSTMTRIKYKDLNISARKYFKTKFVKGDIVVVNEKLGRYKGELQVITNDVPNNGTRNYFGKIKTDDLELLKFVKPWSKFKLISE